MSEQVIKFWLQGQTARGGEDPLNQHDMIIWKALVQGGASMQVGEVWKLSKGPMSPRDAAMVLRDAALKLQNYGTVADEPSWAPEVPFNEDE